MPMAFDYEGVAKQRVVADRARRLPRRRLGPPDRGPRRRQSTGHGLPAPNSYGPFPLNLVDGAGSTPRDELVAGMDRGLLVTRFHYTNPVHPKLAIVTGMTRDGTFLVEGGKIVGPVRNLRFTQSYLEALAGDRRGRPRAADAERRLRRRARAGGPHRRLELHGRHGALTGGERDDRYLGLRHLPLDQPPAQPAATSAAPSRRRRNGRGRDPSPAGGDRAPPGNRLPSPRRCSGSRRRSSCSRSPAWRSASRARVRAYAARQRDRSDCAGADPNPAVLEAELSSLPLGVDQRQRRHLHAAVLRRVAVPASRQRPGPGRGHPGHIACRGVPHTLIPVRNLWKVPGIITDVLYRLDPKAGGVFMVGVAWLGLSGAGSCRLWPAGSRPAAPVRRVQRRSVSVRRLRPRAVPDRARDRRRVRRADRDRRGRADPA